ncbi:Probable RNA-directed DNA polymerase from transposon BS [Eumeta japonica]|uniref:Probable RNA-directed DNA polymerase from transposon BS n=1 Tax=Eumeta variegata TaxID=151549 RepID=A0A4C1ZLQ8_EUMVA|nr:Probable RNA-directed DNA polymerase from transposon BS [Eumeta japonica]
MSGGWKRRFVIESPPTQRRSDPITLDEVSKLIKGLKIRKSPGRDTISSKAIKCFSAPLVALLVAIFNACIQNCYFPTAWKEAVVIGIPKPGKPRDLPASYRPISLLSVLVRPIRAGVPQGSTLSPLYSAYVNDIPRPSSGVQLALFADDTALYLRSNCLRNILPRLQRAIDELTQWLRLWRIESVRVGHTCARAHGRPIMGFSSPSLSQGKTTKKKTYPHPPPPEAIDELGQWFRLWRIEVNPEKSAAIQFGIASIESIGCRLEHSFLKNVERENSVATVL